MLSNVLLKTLRDHRKFLAWMSFGVIAIAAYTTQLYPVIQDFSGLQELWDQMPEAVKALVGSAFEITTPEGFLNAEVFAIIGLILFCVYGITRGAGAIAGEEEAHTLDQLLSNPVTRRRIYIDKWLAMTAGAILLAALLCLAILAGSAITGNVPSVANLTAACFSAFLLMSAAGTIAFAIGAATGRKGTASGVTVGILVIGYLVNSFQTLVGFLEPFRFISLVYYYNGNDVLLKGISWGHAGALALVTAIAFVIGMYLFDRRDLA